MRGVQTPPRKTVTRVTPGRPGSSDTLPMNKRGTHIDFLKRQLAALNAALAPLPPIDYNVEFRKQIDARKTSLTVTFTKEFAE